MHRDRKKYLLIFVQSCASPKKNFKIKVYQIQKRSREKLRRFEFKFSPLLPGSAKQSIHVSKPETLLNSILKSLPSNNFKCLICEIHQRTLKHSLMVAAVGAIVLLIFCSSSLFRFYLPALEVAKTKSITLHAYTLGLDSSTKLQRVFLVVITVYSLEFQGNNAKRLKIKTENAILIASIFAIKTYRFYRHLWHPQKQVKESLMNK